MLEVSMAYIGRKSCGCVVAAISDKPELVKDIAKETGSWLRHGLTVEHVTADYVRANLTGCKCNQLARRKRPVPQPSLPGMEVAA